MPIQDNEVTKQPELEADAHKSETLLPIFHMAYGSHMDTLIIFRNRKLKHRIRSARAKTELRCSKKKLQDLKRRMLCCRT